MTKEDKKLFYAAKVTLLFVCIITLVFKVYKWYDKPLEPNFTGIATFEGNNKTTKIITKQHIDSDKNIYKVLSRDTLIIYSKWSDKYKWFN